MTMNFIVLPYLKKYTTKTDFESKGLELFLDQSII